MTGYIDQMGASGINLARIWMAPWFGGIEWHKTVPGYHGIGQYNLRNAQQLDWIFERAAAHGIVVDLALQNHGPFASTYDRQWNENPYNSVHGGPLEDRRKVMTDPEAMRLFSSALSLHCRALGCRSHHLWLDHLDRSGCCRGEARSHPRLA